MNARGWDAEQAQALIEGRKHLPGALLPMLHALQDEFGYIDGCAVPLIAEALNISRAEVHGVISFYHDFRTHPPGRHVLKVCRAEACQAMGCERLVEHLETRLGVTLGQDTAGHARAHTNANESFTVETVYCLGNCALSPAVMLDGEPHGRVTPDVADALIDLARNQDPA